MSDEAPYLRRPNLDPAHINPRAQLPYQLTVDQVMRTLERTYDFLHDLNVFLTLPGNEYGRLEDLLLGNSFAGVLSEVLVRTLARTVPSLAANRKVGGFPDVLPIELFGAHPAELHAEHGIEVKASKQSGGWQGHNPEAGWYMIFRYAIDTATLPVEARASTRFVQVLAARLEMSDWKFAGRGRGSRRTPTASISKAGMHKLRANPVYQHPAYVVHPDRYGLTPPG